jgi:transcriptional regulator with XRE-family HTH domain
VSTVYRKFADNLMRLALERGSIAEVCRAIGINRQQFNKYLSGTVLPNQSTLSRLARYFDLTERELFCLEAAVMEKRTPTESFPNAFVKASKEANLAEGKYSFYMPWSVAEGFVTRSIMILSRINGLLTFTRHLKLRESLDVSAPEMPLEMRGIVFQNGQQVVFCGREGQGWNNYVATYAFNLGNRTLDGICPGLAVVFTQTSYPLTLSGFLMKEEDQQDHFTNIGVFPIDDGAIPQKIRSIFAAKKSEIGILHCLKLSKDLRPVQL